MATLAQLFEKGYQTGQQQARGDRGVAAAEAKYGPRADAPGLFSALQNQDIQYNQDQRAQATTQSNLATAALARKGVEQKQQVAGEGDKGRALLGVVNGLIQARDSGKDVGAAFDKLAPTLKSLGVNPSDFGALRSEVVKDPKMLDSLKTSLVAPGNVGYETPNKYNTQADGVSAEQGKQQVSDTINQMRDLYTQLYKANAIPASDQHNVFTGIERYVRSSPIGRTVGHVLGSSNETARNTIEGLRPSLIIAIKNADKLGARMFNSDKDMQLWLSMLTDPSRSYESNMALLNAFDQHYGAAKSGKPMAPMTSDYIRSLSAKSGKSENNTNQVVVMNGKTITLKPGWKNPQTGAVYTGGPWNDPTSWTSQ